MKIAILGGTGNIGPGLAHRWMQSGMELLIGSRTAEKAQKTAKELAGLCGRGADQQVSGMENTAAAEKCDLAVLTVPWAHQAALLKEVRTLLHGKILIDVTVPLVPPAVDIVQIPAEGSAALVARDILGPEVRLVSAFQNVAAHHLQKEGPIDCDVLISSDDEEAAEEVYRLAILAGMRAFYVGPLANAVVAESLTALLIHINRRRKCHAGVKITGAD